MSNALVLSHLRWPSLAQDLAIMTVPGTPLTDLQAIYDTYGVDEQSLKELLAVPEFQNMFKTELERCKAQGSKAGVLYRFGTLSQALSEKLYRDAIASQMEMKDAIKFLELLLKAGGMLNDKEQSVNTQVNVGIALPVPQGLKNPKLNHLAVAQ